MWIRTIASKHVNIAGFSYCLMADFIFCYCCCCFVCVCFCFLLLASMYSFFFSSVHHECIYRLIHLWRYDLFAVWALYMKYKVVAAGAYFVVAVFFSPKIHINPSTAISVNISTNNENKKKEETNERTNNNKKLCERNTRTHSECNRLRLARLCIHIGAIHFAFSGIFASVAFSTCKITQNVNTNMNANTMHVK